MDARPNISLTRATILRLAVIAVVVASLSVTPSTAAAAGPVDPSVVASNAAGKPVTVVINTFGSGTWSGGAFVAGNEIFLGQDAYRDTQSGGGVGLFLLLHEAGHLTGIVDEHAADCFGLGHIKAMLRGFWHFRTRQVDQRYRDALLWPGKYDGNGCGGVARR